jgi:tetratricopeptide (TPR) repeat protein
MGLCYYHLARPNPEDKTIMSEAIENYSKAIKVNPLAIYYFNRGNVHLNQKDFRAALNDFDQAI